MFRHLKFLTVFHSNHGNTSHTLISCTPVSLKDQLSVKIINNKNNSKEKGEEEEEGVEIKPSHALEVSVELISKYIIIIILLLLCCCCCF